MTKLSETIFTMTIIAISALIFCAVAGGFWALTSGMPVAVQVIGWIVLCDLAGNVIAKARRGWQAGK